ncbi:MAG: magnesium transporter CorA family protein [Saprospiraceae bacterium]|nr:magnesium transporter CorA family protein [Bacteroidia bacterium]NNE14239.1 magnesium transporter CorA family protein [Saprospiraceae bacterium]NNL93686.1 magnesium transporter CorA family protein [Saprospiraceae bacterium]
MIQYFTFQDRKVVKVEALEEASWVHLCPPFEDQEFELYAKAFNIPIDFITDSLDIDERSRYEIEDNAKLILINTSIINQSLKETEAIYVTVPIGIVMTENVILTITPEENPVIDKFINNRLKNFKPIDQSHFILNLFEQNVFWFLECLKKLNLKRNLIEQELYNSSRNEELRQLLKIEKSLVYFVNSLSANELLMMKMKRTDFLKLRDKDPHEDLFEDIIIDNGQALEMSNVYTNILSGTMEAYASIVSNNLNAFIHRLTIITIILMVPTLVASFYGMNLDFIPFSNSRYTFFGLIFISLILGFLLILFLGRNNKIRH